MNKYLLLCFLSLGCSSAVDGSPKGGNGGAGGDQIDVPDQQAGGEGGAGGGGGEGGAGGAGGHDDGETPTGGVGGASEGGAGGSGSSAGGQAGGSGPEVPPEDCPHLICEDFETGEFDGSTFRGTWRGNLSIRLTTERASHGRRALQVNLPLQNRGGVLQYLPRFDYNGPLYGRFYMYLEKDHYWNTSYILRLRGENPLDRTSPQYKTIEFGGKKSHWQLVAHGKEFHTEHSRRGVGCASSGALNPIPSP